MTQSPKTTALMQPIGPASPRHLWSIQTFLGLLVIACLVPGLVGAALLFLNEFRDGRDRLEEDTIQTARALVQTTDAYLMKTQVAAQSLSTAGSLSRRDFADFHRRARKLLEATQPGSNFVLSDATGQQVVNTFREFGEPLPRHGNLAVLRRVLETGKPVISDLFIGGVTQRPIMSIDVPVFVGGKAAYVLSIGVQPEAFNAILQNQRLPSAWVAAIFDATGTIVARTHAAEQFVGQKGTAEFIRRIQEVGEGAMETITREGIPSFSVFSRSSTTGWSVGIGIPRSILEAELHRTLWILAAGIVMVFALGIGLAWFMGRRIAHSVRSLTASALALGTGEKLTVPLVHISEAAEAAIAMVEAAGLLSERTAALQASNQALQARDNELVEAHRLGNFGTWHWSLASGEVRVSQEIRHIYGQEVPPFAEQRGTLLSVESWERVNAAAAEAIRTGKGYDLELQVIHGNGSLIWVNARCEAIRGTGGAVIALRGTVQDITERKTSERALLDSETRFRATFEQAAVGMAHVSLDGRWVQVNDKLCTIVGYERDALLGLTFQDHTHPDDLETDLGYVQRLLAGTLSSYSMEKRYIRKNGAIAWVNLTVALVRTPKGKPDYFVSVIEDIQPRKEAEAALDEARKAYQRHLEQQVAERTEALTSANRELNRLAHQDALTGLQNRLSANERLRFEFLRLKRIGSAYSVLMMDIDRFKAINDTYGHEAGDNVLQQLSEILSGAMRTTDFVARFGGEEFLVILPDTGAEGAWASAEKIRQAVAEQAFPAVGGVTLSIGAATAWATDANEDEAVRRADEALYRAKEGGRNTVRA